MVITDSGQGLQLVLTSCSGGGCDIGGVVVAGVARATRAGSPQGSYGVQFNNLANPGVSIGVAAFDGAGNVAISFTFVGAGQSAGGVPVNQAPVFSGTLTGTYSVNPDGSGMMNLAPAPGASNGQMYAFVIIDGGSGALLLQLNRSGNGVLSGTARL